MYDPKFSKQLDESQIVAQEGYSRTKMEAFSKKKNWKKINALEVLRKIKKVPWKKKDSSFRKINQEAILVFHKLFNEMNEMIQGIIHKI